MGVVNLGPSILQDKDNNFIESIQTGSSYALGVVVMSTSGVPITSFGSTTVSISSGTFTPSSAVTVTPSSAFTVALSSVATVTPSSAITVALSSVATVTPSSAISVRQSPASLGTVTSVTASSSSQTILASNANRMGATVFNESNQVLYLTTSSATTSTAAYSVQMPSNGYYETPYNYVGAITGLWATSSGAGRITELSS